MKLSQKASMICMGLDSIFFRLIIFFKMQFCCMNRTLRARSSHAIKYFFYFNFSTCEDYHKLLGHLFSGNLSPTVVGSNILFTND